MKVLLTWLVVLAGAPLLLHAEDAPPALGETTDLETVGREEESPPPTAPVEEVEEILPTAFPVSRYTEIWENSPFNREVAPPVAQTIESQFVKNLVLEGVVNDNTRGTIAYVRDTSSDTPLVITKEPTDGHAFTVVSANQDKNPEKTKITITDGTETGEIGFATTKLTEAISQPAPAQAQQPKPRGEVERNIPGLPNRPAGGGQSGGPKPPEGSTPPPPEPPQSVTPALDKMDTETRRRRVPLPGG